MTRGQHRQLMLDSVREFWSMATTAYPQYRAELQEIGPPSVKTNLRGRCFAGTASTTKHQVALNLDMLSEEGPVATRVTTGHEVAHIVDKIVNWEYHVWRLGLGKPRDIHGSKWKDVMISFGLKSSRLHNYKRAARMERSV